MLAGGVGFAFRWAGKGIGFQSLPVPSCNAPAELGGVEEQAALPKPMARCKNVEAA